MWVIVGLGNPGREYERTRHNVGFWAIDLISQQYGVELGGCKCGAMVGEGEVVGQWVVLAKPQAFMNLSGEVVECLLRRFGATPGWLLVIHDDLDICLGEYRVKSGGGDAGHRGVRSIIDALGTPDFYRIRIGIGRPPQGMDATDYVLSPFGNEGEVALVHRAIQGGSEALKPLLSPPGEAASRGAASSPGRG